MRIDAEVHLINPDIYTPAYRLSDKEVFFKNKIYTHPEGAHALNMATVEKLMESMDTSNIDKCLVMGLPFLERSNNQEVNKYIAAACKKHYKKLFGFGILDPLGDVEEQLRMMKNEYGFYGVKVIPSWQNFALDSDEIFNIIETIIRYNFVFLPHINYIISGLISDGPHALFNLIKKFPSLKVLAPHLGGLLCFHYAHEPVRKYFKNVRFITSVVETMKLVSYAAEILEDYHLVFGTDYPFQPNHDQVTVMERFEALKLRPELKEKIYSKNLINFLNVEF